MRRNLTPRPVKAAGARDAHGSILDPSSGSLYVHMHRESGLAHRHYVLNPFQVRALRGLLSRPMLLLYVAAIVIWGWMAMQAVRVQVLQRRIGVLTHESARLDTLTIRLTELQDRYDQVERMLSSEKTATAREASRTKAAPVARPAVPDTARDTTPSTTAAPMSPMAR